MTCASCSSVGQDHVCWRIFRRSRPCFSEALFFLSFPPPFFPVFPRIARINRQKSNKSFEKFRCIFQYARPKLFKTPKIHCVPLPFWIDLDFQENGKRSKSIVGKFHLRVSFERAGYFTLIKKRKKIR